ncbi:MAG: multidrug transporter, partial [Proteobacteria bacterium]|nr:multidrug transporter [Pseudomonadota bacterium]
MASGLAGAVSVDPRHADAASGLAGFLQMAIAAGFSWLVGALLAETALPLALVMATA